MHTIDLVIADITDDRARLIKSLHSFPDQLFAVRPSEEEWSVGEVLAHLSLVEQGIARLLSRLLERGKVDETISVENGVADENPILPSIPSERIRASERATPDRALSKAEALDALAACREELLNVARRSVGCDLKGVTFPHPILGDLNFHQWLLFVGAHERRHVGQIERVKETLSNWA